MKNITKNESISQLSLFSSQLGNFEFDGDQIRHQDGLWSVFDIVRVIGGQKGERKVWERITNNYSDIVAKCHSVKFPRKDGKKANLASPACDRQVALEIIGLLPGEVGRKYREESAKLFLRYIDADLSLATEIVKRSSNQKDVDEHIKTAAEHSKYLESYHGVHDQLQLHGCQKIHHATYNKQVNGIVGIPDGTRPEMERRHKLKMTMLQIAGELALEDDKQSVGWEAVNTAVNAGKLSIAPFK